MYFVLLTTAGCDNQVRKFEIEIGKVGAFLTPQNV